LRQAGTDARQANVVNHPLHGLSAAAPASIRWSVTNSHRPRWSQAPLCWRSPALRTPTVHSDEREGWIKPDPAVPASVGTPGEQIRDGEVLPSSLRSPDVRRATESRDGANSEGVGAGAGEDEAR
jgi:hypothetical protein